MRRLVLVALAIWLVGCTSCSKEQDNGASSASIPAPVNPRLEPIATEEDFEEAAIREIKLSELDAELDRLAVEIKP